MVGLEGDTRKYKGKPRYSEGVAAALKQKTAKATYCVMCGQEIGVTQKNFGGYCFRCFNE